MLAPKIVLTNLSRCCYSGSPRQRGGDPDPLSPRLDALRGPAPYPGEIAPGLTPPLRASDYRHGRVFILRLEIGGISFVHVGTCNLIDEELEGLESDVLFLCMPLWTQIQDYHGRLFSRIRPKIVVPFHFDDFSAPLSPDSTAPSVPWRSERRFLRKIAEKAPEAKILRPELFKTMRF